MKKGILILAIGHPYYGRMAAALAATIKTTGTGIPIHLAYTESAISHLTEKEIALFSSKSIINDKYCTPVPIRSKMFIYQLSPFDETLYLDADLLWFQKMPEDLFEQLKNVQITFSNFGHATGPNLWANFDEVKDAYSLSDEKIYQLHSELIYFKKSKQVKDFFATARKIYDNIKVKAVVFAGGVPDELPFAIAGALHKIYPHQDHFRPAWWKNTEKLKPLHLLYSDYYAMSMAGNTAIAEVIDMYNILSGAAYHKLNIEYPYKWKTKKSFLPERSRI